jgi:2-iminobutanoate/2-iminopropanoate deaminase
MPPGPFGQGSVLDGVVYVAGQVAYDPAKNGPVSDDIREQTVRAIQNLRTVLAEAGAELGDILKLTCILPQLPDHYQAFNEAFREEFGDVFPPRTTIQAGLLGGYLVEIEAVAATDAG